MTGEDISTFVDKLEAGKAQVTDFHKLSSQDWDEIKKLLEARRQYSMQKYINAVFACRIKAEAERLKPNRTFSEAEILAEFGKNS